MDNLSVPGKSGRESRINNAINLGLFSNLFLAILKIVVGIVGNSRALLADGVNSTSDVVNYIVVKIFARLSSMPADREHPYGHHQMESISAVVVGAFVITTAIAIFWDSVNRAYELFTTHTTVDSTMQLFTLLTAIFTIGYKLILYFYTRSVGKKTVNTAVMALAYDHRNDIFASIGVAIGITMNWIGYSWADPLAGSIVALIILKTGIEILRESSEELMDTVPGEMLDKQIRKIVASIKGIDSVEEISAHRFGPYLVINITVCIPGNLPVFIGDAIATEVEERIYGEIELVRKVYVHYHPGCLQQENS